MTDTATAKETAANENADERAFVVMKDVYKIYDMGGNKIHAADGVSLSIN